MKRSRRASLVLMGATPFLMLACAEKQEVPALVYQTEEECKRAGVLDAEDCERQYAWASEESQRIAPRYPNREVCETDFGGYGCQPHGVYYIPRMAGMLLRRPGTGVDVLPLHHSQPLYESISDRGLFITAGNERISRTTGLVNVSPSLLHTRSAALVVSRGGFGHKAGHPGGGAGYGFRHYSGG